MSDIYFLVATDEYGCVTHKEYPTMERAVEEYKKLSANDYFVSIYNGTEVEVPTKFESEHTTYYSIPCIGNEPHIVAIRTMALTQDDADYMASKIVQRLYGLKRTEPSGTVDLIIDVTEAMEIYKKVSKYAIF